MANDGKVVKDAEAEGYAKAVEYAKVTKSTGAADDVEAEGNAEATENAEVAEEAEAEAKAFTIRYKLSGRFGTGRRCGSVKDAAATGNAETLKMWKRQKKQKH